MKPKILITQWIPDEIKNKYQQKAELIYPDKDKISFSDEEIFELIPQADVLFTVFNKADKKVLEAGKNLRAVANLGVGYDSIDVAYASERKIAVINTPNSVTESTAELTVALMLASRRKIVSYDKSMRDGNWQRSAFGSQAAESFGHTLGIVGFGRIGKSVAKKAQAMGMRVFYNDPKKSDKKTEKDLDVQYMSMEDIFSNCDCVSLHLPYTTESHHLVDEAMLSKNEKGRILD